MTVNIIRKNSRIVKCIVKNKMKMSTLLREIIEFVTQIVIVIMIWT